jgi:hypothetical protein
MRPQRLAEWEGDHHRCDALLYTLGYDRSMLACEPGSPTGRRFTLNTVLEVDIISEIFLCFTVNTVVCMAHQWPARRELRE